jgi:hypothetical protein
MLFFKGILRKEELLAYFKSLVTLPKIAKEFQQFIENSNATTLDSVCRKFLPLDGFSH